jgi:endonuclease YncB( thermonuclease family)
VQPTRAWRAPTRNRTVALLALLAGGVIVAGAAPAAARPDGLDASKAGAVVAPAVPSVRVDAPRRAIEARVVRVLGGDTIRVCCIAGREEPVRYIGIKAAEATHPIRGEEPGGREAIAINRALVEGRIVRLELDEQVRDRFGRVLAYVWVEREGEEVMVNAELLRLGYARLRPVPPNVRYQEEFRNRQREAREGGRGLWSRWPAHPMEWVW